MKLKAGSFFWGESSKIDNLQANQSQKKREDTFQISKVKGHHHRSHRHYKANEKMLFKKKMVNYKFINLYKMHTLLAKDEQWV